jgi:hypothetical protein
VSASDQTDVLEEVATLSNKPELSDERDHGNESETTDQPELSEAEDMLTAPPSAPSSNVDVPQDDTYTKFGPGPLTAVRFKWTTRRDDNGDYFVHETIGESSHPLVSGPMTKEAAIEFVDDREREAHQRFEELRSEMAGEKLRRSIDE